jgi:hypothetical protein
MAVSKVYSMAEMKVALKGLQKVDYLVSYLVVV